MVEKTPKKKVKLKIFAVQCLLRHYTYEAFVNAETGKLIRITAGCRVWKTFNDAHLYYDGKSCGIHYWRHDANAHLNNMASDNATENFYCRREARTIISRLENMVGDYRSEVADKRKKAAAKAKAKRA